MTDSQKLDLIIDILGEIKSTRLTNPSNLDGGVLVAEKSLDGLGRITIPKSIRKELDIDENTRLKIYRGQNEIIIKKGWQTKGIMI